MSFTSHSVRLSLQFCLTHKPNQGTIEVSAYSTLGPKHGIVLNEKMMRVNHAKTSVKKLRKKHEYKGVLEPER